MELLTGICLRNFTPGRYLHDFRVVAFDMDSTLINIECIDELAKVHGCGEQVSRITEAAMQGHISDYASSLRQRVACLAGLSVSSLQEVYENKLKLNPGVAEFLDICQSQRLVTILVSGGFTYFTERIQRLLGIDYVLSNELEIIDGALTGHLLNPSVCDGEAKKKMLMEVCHKHHISLKQAISVGDGSNDIPMFKLCNEAGGLSIAFHAKPAVQAIAQISIMEGGMERILEVLPVKNIHPSSTKAVAPSAGAAQ